MSIPPKRLYMQMKDHTEVLHGPYGLVGDQLKRFRVESGVCLFAIRVVPSLVGVLRRSCFSVLGLESDLSCVDCLRGPLPVWCLDLEQQRSTRRAPDGLLSGGFYREIDVGRIRPGGCPWTWPLSSERSSARLSLWTCGSPGSLVMENYVSPLCCSASRLCLQHGTVRA